MVVAVAPAPSSLPPPPPPLRPPRGWRGPLAHPVWFTRAPSSTANDFLPESSTPCAQVRVGPSAMVAQTRWPVTPCRGSCLPPTPPSLPTEMGGALPLSEQRIGRDEAPCSSAAVPLASRMYVCR